MNGHELGCGCSSCRGAATPATVQNRHGLPEISYRSGTYGDFLSSMLDALPSAPGNALSGLRTRDADDPTIALLDAFAVTCDVLTFYTERLANEAFLGTATERTSLQELGALVAYRLGRGVAAEAMLAFTVERPPALPSRDGQDPGILPPAVPQRVVLPIGLRVQSVPGPGEKPQTFETIEVVEARPEWNALPVVRTVAWEPSGSTEAWVAGDSLRLNAGDVVLISLSARADLRVLTAAEAELGRGRTRIAWSPGLEFTHDGFDEPPDPAVRVMRKRLSVFGHSAAQWNAMSVQFRKQYTGLEADELPSDWPDFGAVDFSNGVRVDVEGSHPDIVPGSWVVVARETAEPDWRVFRVISRAELSRSQFAVSGRITRLGLEGPDDMEFGTPRDALVYAVPEFLDLQEVPDLSPVDESSFWIEGDAADMAPGRGIVLVGTQGGKPVADELEIEGATRAGGRTLLTLTEKPAHTFDRQSAVVFGNAVRATHGETVGQLLGSGDARMPFAAVGLAQGPLTFVSASTPRGTASTLEVRVDEVAWTEVPTTAIAGDRDRVFMTRDEPGGGLSVVFGDGTHGERPPTGLNNLRASYRIGVGAAGNVAADALSMPLDRPLGLKAVTNPRPAEGGVDPEPESSARRSIPIPVLTLGRVVSLRDYADFALAFTGIGMAQAVLLPRGGGAVVALTVADADGLPPAAATLERLDDELARYGDPSSRHLVVACRPASFRLGLTVTLDPGRRGADVLEAVATALKIEYSAPVRGFGSVVHASAVTACAASVAGVDAVDLDLLYRFGPPALRRRLGPAAASFQGTTLLGAEILAIAGDPFDLLEVRS